MRSNSSQRPPQRTPQTRYRPAGTVPPPVGYGPQQPAGRPASRGRSGPSGRQGNGGCLTGGLLGLLAFLILVLIGLGILVLGYVTVARDLPSPNELLARSSQFQTTQIYDRNGQLLQEPLAPDDPTAGRRRRVSLNEISPYLIQATISTEDTNFYHHPGVDPIGLSRAMFNALRTRGPVVGTSTISQQLVKMVFLSPERTVSRKVKEAILAAEITRRYDKDTILEIYLNEINYGHLAYGIEAAAQIYFNKPASDLTLTEAALLAGLPQSPAFYDPLQHPEAAKARQADVLRLMVQHDIITPAEADAAWLEELSYYGLGLQSTRLDKAPHFVMFVRGQIEQLYGPEVLYRGGLQVYTSLDLALQAEAEAVVQDVVGRFQEQRVSNGALVAIKPGTGEILAMVGSADFTNPEIDGQVNVAISPRQPGSSIKPFTYLATFEKPEDWWTPATIIDDVPSQFDDGPGRPPYEPRNYDGQFHGLVSMRTALANSYNIPAVKALEHVSVDALLDVADRVGLSTLTRPDHPPYGLSLTLGGGEVTLLEMTGAYATLANGGLYTPPAAILCVLDPEGRVVERLDVPALPEACQQAEPLPGAFIQAPLATRAASAQHAYLLTDILKDNEARTPVFGPNSPLRLDRPAAAKTGTSNDVRDGWTVGYTPDLVTGVWVGNADGSPMASNLSGSQVAAPIWNHFMSRALAGFAPRDFPVPEGVEFVEVCKLTGAMPDSTCPPDQRRTEVFAAGQLPPGADRTRYQVLLMEPRDGEAVQDVVRIVGSVIVPDFDHYLVEYGESHDPGAWGRVAGPIYEPVQAGELALWDTRTLSRDGPHVLRVVAVDKRGARFESLPVRLTVYRPAPTEPPASTPTSSPTGTPAPTVKPTAVITATAIIILTPSATPTPSLTAALPTATATALPPTATPVLPTPTATVAPPTATPTPTELPAPPTATLPPTISPLPTPTATSTLQPAGPGPAEEPSLVAGLGSPQNGAMVSGVVAITGQASGADFQSYRLEAGQDGNWQTLPPGESASPAQGILGQWDTRTVADGVYTLRLLVRSTFGEELESRVSITVANQ